MTNRTYETFAALLRYPETGYHAAIRDCLSCVPLAGEEAISGFAAWALTMTLEQAQENFTAALDLNPKCALELGWHLFGEKYERGLLLVRMRHELRRHGIPESKELPDHLALALLLLSRMERGQAEAFAAAIVFPALEKLLAAMQESANPYEPLIRAINTSLRSEFPQCMAAPPAPSLVVLHEGAQ